jgi:BirA family biotin operon repressor/biotin-[acetyl-CoA-carboxylase] ligase
MDANAVQRDQAVSALRLHGFDMTWSGAMQVPALPSGIELVQAERAESVREEALRRAREGAAEGTFVLVESPSRAYGRRGREWLLPDHAGLHGAFVLRPDLPAVECVELAVVAAVAIGSAVSEFVQPMTELHYRWPNDVLLNAGKACGLWMDAGGTAESLDWLVISWALNTNASPEGLGHDAASIAVEGAAEGFEPGDLVQAIARAFVATITTWDQEGFEPVLRHWRARVPEGDAIAVELHDGERVEGIVERIDEQGGLVLRTDSGERSLSLNAFLGLPTEVV